MKTFKQLTEGYLLRKHLNRAVDKKTGEHRYFRWTDGTGPLQNIKHHDGPNGHVYMTASNGDAEFEDGSVMLHHDFTKRYHHRAN